MAERKWDAFVNKFVDDEAAYQARSQIKQLAREGIPAKHRPRLWFVLSGAHRKREQAKATKQGYAALIAASKDTESVETEQIEKDLHRTGLEEFSGVPELMMKLRRVLRAFAHRNQEIGYCQAMNFIAGLLLLQMPETNAFWTFTAIIEDIMPRSYYDTTMRDLHIDIRTFSDLLRAKLPKTEAHLAKLDVVIQPITTIRFMGIFVHSMPTENVCRVWDCLLMEGSKILFRIALGLLKLKQKEFLATTSFEDGYQCLMNALTPEDIAQVDVMKVCFNKRWIGKFSMSTITFLRSRHAKQVDAELAKVKADREEYEASKRMSEAKKAVKDAQEMVAAEEARESAMAGGEGEAQAAHAAQPTDHTQPDAEADGEQGDTGGEEDVEIEGEMAVLPDKYSKVYNQLYTPGFAEGRRSSFAMMVNYAKSCGHASACGHDEDFQRAVGELGGLEEGDGEDWSDEEEAMRPGGAAIDPPPTQTADDDEVERVEC